MGSVRSLLASAALFMLPSSEDHFITELPTTKVAAIPDNTNPVSCPSPLGLGPKPLFMSWVHNSQGSRGHTAHCHTFPHLLWRNTEVWVKGLAHLSTLPQSWDKFVVGNDLAYTQRDESQNFQHILLSSTETNLQVPWKGRKAELNLTSGAFTAPKWGGGKQEYPHLVFTGQTLVGLRSLPGPFEERLYTHFYNQKLSLFWINHSTLSRWHCFN